MSRDEIKISEDFHSIQGEGKTAGSQAVFVRLQSCNLLCGGKGTVKDKELHNGATWRCDTIETWLQGNTYSISEACEHIISQYEVQLLNGSHLIWTGGEPLLQQEAIFEIMRKISIDKGVKPFFVEVETNGTIVPDSELINRVDLFNVSPKLSNSGMPEHKRINRKPLDKLASMSFHDKAIFKFVVSRTQDFVEIERLIKRFEINKDAVYIMPACSDRETWNEVSGRIANSALEKGYNFSPRLQVALWDKTVGV